MAHSIHADCMNTVGRSLSLIATPQGALYRRENPNNHIAPYKQALWKQWEGKSPF